MTGKQIVIINIAVVVCAMIGHLYWFPQVVEPVEITISTEYDYSEKLKLITPIWFFIDQDSIKTIKSIDDGDKLLLYSLLDTNDEEIYAHYKKQIDEIAYMSNKKNPITTLYFWLTLCYVIFGCVSRSFYDYIGHKCYRKDLNVDIWSAWYLIRLFISIPITAFVIVAIRCSLPQIIPYSNNVYTYLIICFLLGFTMMELLGMLRNISKTILNVNSHSYENKNVEDKK